MCTEGVKVILLSAGNSLDILGIEPDKSEFKPFRSRAATSTDKSNCRRWKGNLNARVCACALTHSD